MANLELQNKINVPFAAKGDKINVPDTNSDGTVNMTDGFGSKYDTPIAEGGEYIYREEMNDILNKVYAAVKELQDLAVTAGFPVDMTKALNVLPLANGGTGANNATQARSNLGLGTIATLNTIKAENIANNAVTGEKIVNNTIPDSKLTGTISLAHGGTGRTDGMCTGVNDNKIRTEDNWSSNNTRGLSVTYWQTAEHAKKGLPTTAGALISNVFTANLKSFLALNLSSTNPELRIRGSASDWKKVALMSDVSTPPITYTTDIGTWVETPLNNGSVMFEGWGIYTGAGSANTIITLPKKVKAGGIIVAMGIAFGALGWYGTILGFTSDSSNSVDILENTTNGQGKINVNNWYIKGILA